MAETDLIPFEPKPHLEDPTRMGGIIFYLLYPHYPMNPDLTQAFANIKQAVATDQTDLLPARLGYFVALAQPIDSIEIRGIARMAQAIIYLTRAEYEKADSEFFKAKELFEVSEPEEVVWPINTAAAWLGVGYADWFLSEHIGSAEAYREAWNIYLKTATQNPHFNRVAQFALDLHRAARLMRI